MARVIAIDDDLDILAVVEGSLEAEGYKVLAISNPRQAIVEAESFKPDAIILDVNMPELDGFDVLRLLQANAETKAIPVLFLSALGEAKHRVRGLELGAEDYLAKPFSPAELVLRVGRLCAQRFRQGAEGAGSVSCLQQALKTDDFNRFPVSLGRYRVTGRLGEGGMGMVLEGFDARLQRAVAIKTMRLSEWASEEEIHRGLKELLGEGAMLARFCHPNIVNIYDSGVVREELAYIVLELVRGRSLHEPLASGESFTIQRILEIGLAVAGALGKAAEAGVVHQDIKPGNILISDSGEVKVADFGVAQLMARSQDSKSVVFGTPGYVAPEALCYDGRSHLSDIYSLGAILYRCLSGVEANGSGSIAQVLVRTLRSHLDPLPTTVPEALAKLVLRMLAHSPEQRPAAPELSEQLRRIQSTLSSDELARCVGARETPQQEASQMAHRSTHIDLKKNIEAEEPTL